MFISLFPTPFDHFHFHPTLGLDPALILTLRLKPIECFIAYLNHVVSCCSHPVHLSSHDSLAETKVTTYHLHVFVAHRSLRNLSLPASGKWGFKQSFYSLFRPDGEVMMTTGRKILTITRTVSKKKR